MSLKTEDPGELSLQACSTASAVADSGPYFQNFERTREILKFLSSENWPRLEDERKVLYEGKMKD